MTDYEDLCERLLLDYSGRDPHEAAAAIRLLERALNTEKSWYERAIVAEADARLFRELYAKEGHAKWVVQGELSAAEAEAARLREELRAYRTHAETGGLRPMREGETKP
jgi:hypothetical protein